MNRFRLGSLGFVGFSVGVGLIESFNDCKTKRFLVVKTVLDRLSRGGHVFKFPWDTKERFRRYFRPRSHPTEMNGDDLVCHVIRSPVILSRFSVA